MNDTLWTREPPKIPGWYWCQNAGDNPGEIWEAVIRIDVTPTGLVASWMTAPGEAATMHEDDFSDKCRWIGPITPTDNFRRCQICGMAVDVSIQATKPTIDFGMRGRTKTK